MGTSLADRRRLASYQVRPTRKGISRLLVEGRSREKANAHTQRASGAQSSQAAARSKTSGMLIPAPIEPGDQELSGTGMTSPMLQSSAATQRAHDGYQRALPPPFSKGELDPIDFAALPGDCLEHTALAA